MDAHLEVPPFASLTREKAILLCNGFKLVYIRNACNLLAGADPNLAAEKWTEGENTWTIGYCNAGRVVVESGLFFVRS